VGLESVLDRAWDGRRPPLTRRGSKKEVHLPRWLVSSSSAIDCRQGCLACSILQAREEPALVTSPWKTFDGKGGSSRLRLFVALHLYSHPYSADPSKPADGELLRRKSVRATYRELSNVLQGRHASANAHPERSTRRIVQSLIKSGLIALVPRPYAPNIYALHQFREHVGVPQWAAKEAIGNERLSSVAIATLLSLGARLTSHRDEEKFRATKQPPASNGLSAGLLGGQLLQCEDDIDLPLAVAAGRGKALAELARTGLVTRLVARDPTDARRGECRAFATLLKARRFKDQHRARR
jgi:hypothetical protein